MLALESVSTAHSRTGCRHPGGHDGLSRCLRVLWVKMAQNISRTTFAGGFLFKCVYSGEMQRGKANHILLGRQIKTSLVLACLVYHPNFLVSLSFPAEGTSPMSPAAALGMEGNRARHVFRASRPAVPRT